MTVWYLETADQHVWDYYHSLAEVEVEDARRETEQDNEARGRRAFDRLMREHGLA